jgi:hypothetical protein
MFSTKPIFKDKYKMIEEEQGIKSVRSRKVCYPFKFEVGFQKVRKSKLTKSSCLLHKEADTPIKSEVVLVDETVLEGGQNHHLPRATQAMAKQ